MTHYKINFYVIFLKLLSEDIQSNRDVCKTDLRIDSVEKQNQSMSEDAIKNTVKNRTLKMKKLLTIQNSGETYAQGLAENIIKLLVKQIVGSALYSRKVCIHQQCVNQKRQSLGSQKRCN